MSTTYTLKIVSPTQSGGLTLTCHIDSFKANMELGEKAVVTFTFVKSYVE